MGENGLKSEAEASPRLPSIPSTRPSFFSPHGDRRRDKVRIPKGV